MKTKVLLYAAVVTAVSVSCTREAEESGLLKSGIDLEFTAEWADEKDADSRTVLQEDGTSIWWSANEEINVFLGKEVSAKFVSTNTQPQRLVSFVGNVLIGAAEQEDSFPGYWAVYPYHAENSCDGQSLTLSLPYIQQGKANGFADKFFPSVARSNNFLLSFWNVCGGSRFSVTREGIKRIVFKSNDGSPMAGKVKVGFGEDNKPQILEFSEPVDSVVVNAPEGGFIPGTNYFAAMLPQTHEQGLSVTLWMADKKADKAMSHSISIHRSAFGLLNEIDKGLEFVDAVFPDDLSPEADFEMVDLGLSVKWATCNLGASSPEEYGNYYAWGETEPKDDYSWETYKWCKGNYCTMTKYCDMSSCGYYGFLDYKIILDPEDDAAAVALGGSWRMPTKAEQDELSNNCTWTWTTQNGVNGRLVTGPNGNSIFLPAAGYRNGTSLYNAGSYGYYWSSSLGANYSGYVYYPNYAFYLLFSSSNKGKSGYYRHYGLSVRPVYDDIAVHVEGISINESNLQLTIGETVQLTATVIPENASFQNVKWSSSNTSVANVSDTGLVTAYDIGTAMLTVSTMDGGFSATCNIKVKILPVDLGLSVKWSAYNLGSRVPEGYGKYYAWGEIASKSDYSWSTYKWGNFGDYSSLNKYYSQTEAPYLSDDKVVLDAADDAATVTWGDDWRMPSCSEWTELLENCTWEWTTYNGVNGSKVTSNKAGFTDKWIFLPAAGSASNHSSEGLSGYFWSSTLATKVSKEIKSPMARILLTSSKRSSIADFQRFMGYSIRPVYGKYIVVEGISLKESSMELSVGNSMQLVVSIYPVDASEKTIEWKSSNNDIVKVTSDGVVTAVNNGWAVITATSLGGNFSASCLIKVGEPAIPDAVNLGLSVPWASFNLGANVPTECGAYFSWGETSPQTTYTWMDYKFCQSWDEYGNIMLSKYNLDSKYGSVDNNDVIDSEDDAATVNLGSEWRMPTAEEWMELQECCTWTWTSVDGVKGMKIESNQEGYTGNWIFLPAAGRWTSMGLGYVGSIGGYWSSSLYGDYSIMAQAYGFANSSSNKMLSQGERYIGASLRPVYVGR